MKMYEVVFKHSKSSRSGYRHQHTDWTLAEGGNEAEAEADARRWIKENRFQNGWKNMIKILEIKELC